MGVLLSGLLIGVLIVVTITTMISLTNGHLLRFIAWLIEGIRNLCGERRRDLARAAKGQALLDVDTITKGHASARHDFGSLNMATVTPAELKYLTEVYQAEVERLTAGRVRAKANEQQLQEISERTRKALEHHKAAMDQLQGLDPALAAEPWAYAHGDPYGNLARQGALERLDGTVDDMATTYTQTGRVWRRKFWDGLDPETRRALRQHGYRPMSMAEEIDALDTD